MGSIIASDLPETVLIVGVNTRPIVRSAKGLGMKAIAVDCFDDVDLLGEADEAYITSKRSSGDGMTRTERLEFLDLALRALEEHDIDVIILGSGLEHEPQIVEELSWREETVANDIDKLKICEYEEKLYEIAEKLGIPHPTTKRVDGLEEVLEISEEIGWPVLLKPAESGGGIGIEVAGSREEVENKFKKVLSSGNGRHLYVQEYIEGRDLSTALLSDGGSVEILTVNEQIIGDERLDAPRKFGYCGNITPYSGDGEKISKMEEYAKEICRGIGLKGSIGIDFILSDKPYLLEINPRFQNTFDLVEGVMDINLLEAHLRAFDGRLIDNERPERYGVKLILYAKRDFDVPDLMEFESAVDIPREGAKKEVGEPVCSVINFGRERKETVESGYETVEKIKQKCYSSSRSSTEMEPE